MLKSKKTKIISASFILFVFLALASEFDKKQKQSAETEAILESLNVPVTSRTFRLGFTPWPPDLSNSAVAEVYGFINEHADLVAHHMDNGVPWQESLDGADYSTHLLEDWQRRKTNTPQGHTVYLALTPLDFDRSGLAPYWGTKDNLPLPQAWSDKALNDPDVMKAYFNYVRRSVEFFDPHYVAIGIESNIMLSKVPEQWDKYLELNKFVYSQLKKEFPNIEIFSTIQLEFLKGIDADASGDKDVQIEGVKNLLMHSDLAAVSTYKYGLGHNPVEPEYFDEVLSLNKKVAIAEMGAMSSDTKVFGMKLKSTDADQVKFIASMLSAAEENGFEFVVNFVAIDYDQLIHKLTKDIAQIANIWVHTGLVDTDRKEKPALQIWDSYSRAPLEEQN